MSYEWLDKVGTLPRVIAEARKLVGTKEVAGSSNNPVIMAWAKEVGRETIGYTYAGDHVPWCGLFAAVVVKRAGKTIPTGPLYALNWVNFGTPVAMRRQFNLANPLINAAGLAPSLGDVLVFKREGGGHVGFYIGEDDKYFCVLGGNQSDNVTFTWIAKARCVAVRRPAMTVPPVSMKPYRLSRNGAAISVNEA